MAECRSNNGTLYISRVSMTKESVFPSSNDVEILSKGVGKWKILLKIPIDQVKGKKELYQKINKIKKQLAESLELPPNYWNLVSFPKRKKLMVSSKSPCRYIRK